MIRIPAGSVVNTLLKARIFINFDHIIINLICGYHPLKVQKKMVRIFAGSAGYHPLKAQKLMRILARSAGYHPLKARIFIRHHQNLVQNLAQTGKILLKFVDTLIVIIKY